MNAITHAAIEITVLAKAGGPLTKRISLSSDGSLNSDGSACVMSTGRAERTAFGSLAEFADCIACLAPNEAIALGVLRHDLPDQVRITTKAGLNGHAAADLIARTGEHIVYRPDQPALVLIDIDTKGIPTLVKDRITSLGGFWSALVSVLPGLEGAGRVVRQSTSAGLFRTDTDERLAGSNGRHVYVVLTDGADAQRFLRRLHERCWLQGLGWLMIGASGQLLERSLVDRMVWSPERLVFEAAPILDSPLAQDQSCRVPDVTMGPLVDSRVACLDLGLVEQAKLRDLRAAEARRLTLDAQAARGRYVEQFALRTGCTAEAARDIVERQNRGILLPSITLTFDAAELQSVTVGDVLADPARFVGATLADPAEGVEYGRCKAKVMQREDGSLWINSFAHGRAVYELKLDAAAAETALNKAPVNEVTAVFVSLTLAADLNADEQEHLRDLASKRAGVGKRAINAKLKVAQQNQAGERAREKRDRRAAERTDARPQISAPAPDAPWLPQMKVLNDVMGTSLAPEPPMRDVEGYVTTIHTRRLPSLHTLTARGTNEGETDETRLPAPEEPLVTRLDEIQLAELIERHIDYIDAGDRSVHLAAPFVKHFRQRNDTALPVVTAVVPLPIVLSDGAVLSGRGLDRKRGIVLRVPGEMQALLPKPQDCTPSAVGRAMQFLADEFLADVATDYAGKCVLIALALTIIERATLPERPAFFVSAGQRSTGKTTALHMISMAVLGRRATASAWSPNEEERRKALFAYLGEGVALLVWDNIPRGIAISCPSIEKALTAETYNDRVLGVTESRTVPATTVQAFTGNNVGPRADMASRSLTARLTVNRTDPENREFTHPDPVGWTEANRGRILSALYTILLGNPRLREKSPVPAETRFKMWWHLIGAAIEYAAKQHAIVISPHSTCPPTGISFRTLFLDGEADEEQTATLATVLDVLRTRWPNGCKASEIVDFVARAEVDAIEFKTALEQASGKVIKIITAITITSRLKALVDAPVQSGEVAYVLRYLPNTHAGEFVVRRIG